MASPPSFGLGGSTNRSLRDVGLAEPSQEVDRPLASQGNEIIKRSSNELPVPPKPHIPQPRDASELNNDGMNKLGDVHNQTEPNISIFLKEI